MDDAVQQDNSIGAAGAAAEAFLNQQISGDGTSQGTQTTTPAQQTPATPSATQQSSTPAGDQPTPLALDDAKTYLWTNPVTGATEPKTGKEIKAGWMQHGDYTRKSQENAALKKQLEPYIQEREQVAGILTNGTNYLQWAAANRPEIIPQLMQALAQHMGQQQPPQQLDPNGIATIGQAQTFAEQQAAALQQQIAQLQHQLQHTVNSAKQEIRDEQAIKGYNDQINPVIKAIFDAHPILNKVPRAEDNIRFDVLTLQRQQRAQGHEMTVQEAVQAFRDIGKRYADDLAAGWQELQKAQVTTQQALVSNGIEPPGGVHVQHQGGGYKTPLRSDGKADFDQIGRDAEAFINSMNRAG